MPPLDYGYDDQRSYALSPSSCVPSTLAGFFGVVAVCVATAAIVVACIFLERWAAA